MGRKVGRQSGRSRPVWDEVGDLPNSGGASHFPRNHCSLLHAAPQRVHPGIVAVAGSRLSALANELKKCGCTRCGAEWEGEQDRADPIVGKFVPLYAKSELGLLIDPTTVMIDAVGITPHFLGAERPLRPKEWAT